MIDGIQTDDIGAPSALEDNPMPARMQELDRQCHRLAAAAAMVNRLMALATSHHDKKNYTLRDACLTELEKVLTK